jgi:hypothetical protein
LLYLSFTPGPGFANNVIQLQAIKGGSVKFNDPALFVDIDYFFQNRIDADTNLDIVIELLSFSAPNKLEGSLATSFSLAEELLAGRTIFKIKNIKQEILLEPEKKWFVMNDIFGVQGESTG